MMVKVNDESSEYRRQFVDKLEQNITFRSTAVVEQRKIQCYYESLTLKFKVKNIDNLTKSRWKTYFTNTIGSLRSCSLFLMHFVKEIREYVHTALTVHCSILLFCNNTNALTLFLSMTVLPYIVFFRHLLKGSPLHKKKQKICQNFNKC